MDWGRLLMALAIAGACAVTGGAVTAAWYSPRLEDKEAQRHALEQAYLRLADRTGEQNEAIQAMAATGERQAQALATAQTKAAGLADILKAKAAEWLARQRQSGADPCQTARAWVDEQLQKERQP